MELGCNLRLKISFNLIHLSKFCKGPATVRAQVIYAWHPVRVHRGLLLLGILAPVAFNFDNQVQQVVLAMAIIHQHDKIGQIPARLRAVAIWHFQAEIVVLDVGLHLRVRLGDAAKLGFPVTVEDNQLM